MRLQRVVAIVLCVACSAGVDPVVLAGAARAQAAGAQQATPQILSGRVVGANGQSAGAGQRVRLRNVNTGAVAGETVTDASGSYSFALSEPGTYVVEALNPDGAVLAVSSAVNSAAALPLSTNVLLPATQVAAGGFFTSTAFLVIAAAASAGTVVAVVGGGGGPGPGPAPVSPEQ